MGGCKIGVKEYLILVSDILFKYEGRMYVECWGIEVFFGCCKCWGFNFEDIYLIKLECINILIYLFGIVFIWVFKIGEIEVCDGDWILIKWVNECCIKFFSIFCVGFDWLW